MSRLFKYEFRKSLFSKLIFVGITGVMEIVYLIGLFRDLEDMMVIGMLGLFFTALAGISFIGIESILILFTGLDEQPLFLFVYQQMHVIRHP